ncbi:hypothetical protein VNO77_37912 [Canavalia gladiata]|uniref:Uncharacterized protein n=1 Tax=Canavalia gladiata TaxID=3824 RepID=A0AAN9KAY1_CANGL
MFVIDFLGQQARKSFFCGERHDVQGLAFGHILSSSSAAIGSFRICMCGVQPVSIYIHRGSFILGHISPLCERHILQPGGQIKLSRFAYGGAMNGNVEVKFLCSCMHVGEATAWVLPFSCIRGMYCCGVVNVARTGHCASGHMSCMRAA